MRIGQYIRGHTYIRIRQVDRQYVHEGRAIKCTVTNNTKQCIGTFVTHYIRLGCKSLAMPRYM